MYRILAPTDFSEISKNGITYAVEFINSHGGHLKIVHYFKDVHLTGHFKSMESLLRADAERDMADLVDECRSALDSGEVPDSQVILGDCSESVDKAARDYRADLIAMGSQGSSNKMQKIFGSTARAIINKVRVPTLIVPPGKKFEPIRNVILACDDELDQENLKFVSNLMKNTGGHLFLLHIGDLQMERPSIDYYSHWLNGSNYSFHNIPGSDIINEINQFASGVESDMIIMLKRKKSFLQRIFTGSHTEIQLFNSDKPLLVLHESSDSLT